jgi:hypothetical protein
MIFYVLKLMWSFFYALASMWNTLSLFFTQTKEASLEYILNYVFLLQLLLYVKGSSKMPCEALFTLIFNISLRLGIKV